VVLQEDCVLSFLIAKHSVYHKAVRIGLLVNRSRAFNCPREIHVCRISTWWLLVECRSKCIDSLRVEDSVGCFRNCRHYWRGPCENCARDCNSRGCIHCRDLVRSTDLFKFNFPYTNMLSKHRCDHKIRLSVDDPVIEWGIRLPFFYFHSCFNSVFVFTNIFINTLTSTSSSCGSKRGFERTSLKECLGSSCCDNFSVHEERNILWLIPSDQTAITSCFHDSNIEVPAPRGVISVITDWVVSEINCNCHSMWRIVNICFIVNLNSNNEGGGNLGDSVSVNNSCLIDSCHPSWSGAC